VGQARPLRTWTDATGQFRIEARLIDVSDGVVNLEKADGETLKVPLEKLSAADQAHCRQAVGP
jgi:hypothetical protein